MGERETFSSGNFFVWVAALLCVTLARLNFISQNSFLYVPVRVCLWRDYLCELWRVDVKQKLFCSSICCCLSLAVLVGMGQQPSLQWLTFPWSLFQLFWLLGQLWMLCLAAWWKHGFSWGTTTSETRVLVHPHGF